MSNTRRTSTLTRHLVSSGVSINSSLKEIRAPAAPKTSSYLNYEQVCNLSLADLQKRFGEDRQDGLAFQGVNHVAFVCSDMARTLWFWCEILGMKLVKTLQLPDDGQHFFIEGGNGCAIAYFFFPKAPKKVLGISSVNIGEMMQGKGFATAHGSVNHVAFNVPQNKLKEYRARVKQANVGIVSPILYHSDVDPSGYSPKRDENTIWESFYFEGPDGEYLEMTAQSPKPFTPEHDIKHKPAIAGH